MAAATDSKQVLPMLFAMAVSMSSVMGLSPNLRWFYQRLLGIGSKINNSINQLVAMATATLC